MHADPVRPDLGSMALSCVDGKRLASVLVKSVCLLRESVAGWCGTGLHEEHLSRHGDLQTPG